MDEFAVLKKCLPLESNLSKYFCIKTKVNTIDDMEFRMECGIDNAIRKFEPLYTDMKPLVVGIKCYLNNPKEEGNGYVYVKHDNRDHSVGSIIDSFDAEDAKWYTFKYPLIANYHTETKIMLAGSVSAYTLAILNTPLRVRQDAYTNSFPAGYHTFDDYPDIYGSFNKGIVYKDGDKYINPAGIDLAKAVVVHSIR